MGEMFLDTTGLKCPQPMLKLAVSASRAAKGDVLVVLGDCPTFERDVRTWCSRLNKTLLSASHEADGAVKIKIRF